MRTLLSVAPLLAVALAIGERVTYEGYKVYEIKTGNVEEVAFLTSMEDALNIDYWAISKLPNRPAVALVAPENQAEFEKELSRAGIQWNILIEDARTVVEIEQALQLQAPPVDEGTISFNAYHSYATMVEYLNRIVAVHPIASVTSIGLSTERRRIEMISICKDECGTKPAIIIECGAHAREWIAPAMCLYVIQELVENQEGTADLTNDVDWHIVPVLNVDGYEHSRDVARFWRKTRSEDASTICLGVDANRNFNFHWENTETKCSETYAGAGSNSEPEVDALDKIIGDLSIGGQVKLYLAIHSFGTYILYPPAWSGENPAGNVEQLEAFGGRVAGAIAASTGLNYVVGNFYDTLYKATGTSMDFAVGKEIELAYTIELPSGGLNGFDLPPEEIEKVVTETFHGIKEFHNIVLETYGGK